MRSLIRLASRVSLGRSCGRIVHVGEGDFASADSIRMTISDFDISSEKMIPGRPCLIEQERNTSIATVDFPIPGLAATAIICPSCSPLVSSSGRGSRWGRRGRCHHGGDGVDLVHGGLEEVCEQVKSSDVRCPVTS